MGFPNRSEPTAGTGQYSQRDIDTLKWLASRQDEKGLSISHAIDLWQETVGQGLSPKQRKQPLKQPANFAAPISGIKLDDIRRAWIYCCLEFDREAAEQILTRALALFSEIVCSCRFCKGLAQVGSDWYEGRTTVQQEHFVQP